MDYYDKKIRMRNQIKLFLKAASKIGGLTATELDVNMNESSMGKKTIINYLDELIELKMVIKNGSVYSWNDKEEKKKEAENEFNNTMAGIGTAVSESKS